MSFYLNIFFLLFVQKKETKKSTPRKPNQFFLSHKPRICWLEKIAFALFVDTRRTELNLVRRVGQKR